MRRRTVIALCSAFLCGCSNQKVANKEKDVSNKSKYEGKTKTANNRYIEVNGQKVRREEFTVRYLKYGQYPNRKDTVIHGYSDLVNIENKHVADFPDGIGYHPLRQATWIMRIITALRNLSLNSKEKKRN